MEIIYIQFLNAILCSIKSPTSIKQIQGQSNKSASMLPSNPIIGSSQGMNTQEIKNNLKPITKIIDTFLDNERKGSTFGEDANHVYQQTIRDTDNTKIRLESNFKTKPEFTNYFSNQGPCLIGFQRIQQDQEKISRNSKGLNNTQPESVFVKTTGWTFLQPSDPISSSCVVNSIKTPLPPQPSAPDFDLEKVLDSNNSLKNLCPHPTAPTMYEIDETENCNHVVDCAEVDCCQF